MANIIATTIKNKQHPLTIHNFNVFGEIDKGWSTITSGISLYP